MTADINKEYFEQLRVIAAEVLEIEPEELTDTGDFAEEYEADSLRSIELLARIEKSFKVDIPQVELPKMVNLQAVYDVVASFADWQETSS